MEVSRSSYTSERRYEETRYDNVPVYQAQSSSVSAYRTEKSVESGAAASKLAVQRHISEASSAGYSDSSAASKTESTHGKKGKDKKRSEAKKAAADRSKSAGLSERWHRVASDYEDNLAEKDRHLHQQHHYKQHKVKSTVRSQQKTSKLSDSSQYDNVRQAFGKGLPLALQTAPPGARARDIETDSMASERSERSWRLGRRKRTGAKQHGQLRLAKSTPNLAEISTQQKRTSRSRHVSRSSGRHAAGSKARSQSAGRHVSYLTDSAPDVSVGYVRRETKHKTKKKDWGLQSEAARIVDGVINNALDFLYGSSGRSRTRHHTSRISHVTNVRTQHGSSSSSSVAHSQSAQRQARVASYSNLKAAERAEHHTEHKVITGSMPSLITSKAQLADQRTANRSAEGGADGRRYNKSLHASSTADVGMRPYGYELGVGALGSSGYQSPSSTANRSSPKYKESFSSTYSASQWSSVSSPGSRPYAGHRPDADLPHVKPAAAAAVYSSDSEYSTTVEIRRKYGSEPETGSRFPAPHRTDLSLSDPEVPAQSARRPGTVNPPTVTKGNITKVFCGSAPDNQPRIPTSDPAPIVAAVHSLDDRTQAGSPTEGRPTTDSTITVNATNMPSPPTMHTRFTHVHKQDQQPDPEGGATYPGLLSIGPVTTTSHGLPERQNAAGAVNLHLDLNKLSPKGQSVQQAVLSPGKETVEVLNSPEAHKLPTIDEVDESRYAAFSNEPMIVADLLNARSNRRPKQQQDYVVQGKLYGTENAIRMNTKQNLNLYIFNQRKDDARPASADDGDDDDDDDDDEPLLDPIPRPLDVVDYQKGKEVEMQEYKIFHKQTQTPIVQPTPPPRRRRKPKPVIVRRVESPPRIIYKDTTHYITKEREIEKLPPEKTSSADVCVQTEPLEPTDADVDDEEETTSEHGEEVHCGWEQRTEVPLSRLGRPEGQLSETYVTHTLPKPIITESRQMESVVEFRNAPSPDPQPSGKEIPVVREKRENFIEKLDREIERQRRRGEEPPAASPEPEKNESESEEEILETTVVEEKEQRIAMAIYEEVEFSAQRKEGGTLVGVDDPVPAFWMPDRFEGVMERKRQKKTLIQNIEKDGEFMRYGSGPGLPALEGSIAISEAPKDFKPKVMADMTVESSRRTYRSDDEKEQKGESQAFRESEQRVVVDREKDAEDKTNTYSKQTVRSSASKGKDIPIHTKITRSEAKHDQLRHGKAVGGLPRQVISLPKVSIPSPPFSPSDDKLPEDLAHFDKVVQELEQELPRRSKSKPKSTVKHIKIQKTGHSGSKQRAGGRRSDGRISDTTAGDGDGVDLPRRVSRYEPDNVSFGRRSGPALAASSGRAQAELELFDREDVEVGIQSAPGLGAIDGYTVHSEQSEPTIQTKYVKDADGNTVKVTELSHTLSKTVEYEGVDKAENGHDPGRPSQEEMHEGSYIDMNLMETVDGSLADEQAETGTSDDGSCVSVIAAKPAKDVAEVTSETSVQLRPVEFDVHQSTIKLDDGADLLEERRLIYDSRQKTLTPLDHDEELYPYETMTTAL